MKKTLGIILILSLLMAACEKRIHYKQFEPEKLFSLQELYEIKTYRSMEEALESPDSVYKLLIFNQNLESVPVKVSKFHYLNVLELTRNQLTTLPLYIGDMLYLQDLYLGFNNFSKVPDCIYRLPNLKRFIIENNKLSDIPAGLTEMQNLEELHLSQNNIEEIPEELYGMRSLKVLKVDNNQISEISPGIANLENLEILYISYNKIKNLPYEITGLQKLRSIYLRGNEIPMETIDSLRVLMPNTKILLD